MEVDITIRVNFHEDDYLLDDSFGSLPGSACASGVRQRIVKGTPHGIPNPCCHLKSQA